MIDHLVCIGSSAGGVEALKNLLNGLAPRAGRGILIVQHMGNDQRNLLPDILTRTSALTVVEGYDKMAVDDQKIIVAPPGYHLLVERDFTLSLAADERVSYARPSIDVTLESAAAVTFENTIGIILTGANSDGAKGLAAIRRVGGICIVQDPLEAMAEAMPRAAIQAADPQWILSLPQITRWLNDHPDKGV